MWIKTNFILIYCSLQLLKDFNCESWCDLAQSAFAKLAVFIIWGSFEGIVLLRKWSVILVLYCLVFYCVILICCVCLLVFTLFFYYFYNWSFQKTLWMRLSLVMSFYYSLSPRNTLRVFLIETIWNTRGDLDGDYFSTDAFWLLLFILCNKLFYYFY